MERMYTNNRPGERRIHVEIGEAEITDLLAELGTPASDTGRQFVEILDVAHRRFGGERREPGADDQ
ncbi:hypothetical protein [Streptomyces uncialis]|uniref:Uncharacterized protein n=1 Tax=Streptomyces uncialis TaxID=1048205 RepID=A0A1Q4V0S3_9ACTN|nr:hypothetical protein [Streptomyces uncialis]OKH91475.1 hypothetical protein AB852_28355 [Streptomyces uncialis]